MVICLRTHYLNKKIYRSLSVFHGNFIRPQSHLEPIAFRGGQNKYLQERYQARIDNHFNIFVLQVSPKYLIPLFERWGIITEMATLCVYFTQGSRNPPMPRSNNVAMATLEPKFNIELKKRHTSSFNFELSVSSVTILRI